MLGSLKANTEATPRIYKLYSISTIYHIKFTDLLLLFGVDLQRISWHQIAMPLEQTHLTNIEAHDGDRAVSFPVRFDPGLNLKNTNLLSRMVEVWGEGPISLIQHLDVRHAHYGYVGLHDYTLLPMLRPRTVVHHDDRLQQVH